MTPPRSFHSNLLRSILRVPQFLDTFQGYYPASHIAQSSLAEGGKGDYFEDPRLRSSRG